MDGSIWEVCGGLLRVARPLFFVRFFEPFFYPPGSILGWFWEAKTDPKIVFFEVLFRTRFCIVFFDDFCFLFCVLFVVFLNMSACFFVLCILQKVDFYVGFLE